MISVRRSARFESDLAAARAACGDVVDEAVHGVEWVLAHPGRAEFYPEAPGFADCGGIPCHPREDASYLVVFRRSDPAAAEIVLERLVAVPPPPGWRPF